MGDSCQVGHGELREGEGPRAEWKLLVVHDASHWTQLMDGTTGTIRSEIRIFVTREVSTTFISPLSDLHLPGALSRTRQIQPDKCSSRWAIHANDAVHADNDMMLKCRQPKGRSAHAVSKANIEGVTRNRVYRTKP